jgi:hypothetical protein
MFFDDSLDREIHVSFGQDVVAEVGRSRRMASLNAMAMVNIFYEDDSRPGHSRSRSRSRAKCEENGT